MLGALDQGELIRATGLVDDLLWVVRVSVNHHSVADRKQLEHVENTLIEWTVRVLQNHLDFIYRGLDHTRRLIVLFLRLWIPPDLVSHLNLLEFHLVLGQRSCFV